MATQILNVFTITETPEGQPNRWRQVGVAFVNSDHSLTVRLDALPVNGQLHIRERNGDSSHAAKPASDTASE